MVQDAVRFFFSLIICIYSNFVHLSRVIYFMLKLRMPKVSAVPKAEKYHSYKGGISAKECGEACIIYKMENFLAA